MNLVLDEAEEVHLKAKTRKTLGKAGIVFNTWLQRYENWNIKEMSERGGLVVELQTPEIERFWV